LGGRGKEGAGKVGKKKWSVASAPLMACFFRCFIGGPAGGDRKWRGAKTYIYIQ
jgi:hypothetical protein